MVVRVPRPRRLCIFCEGTQISKEHVYANWMRPYIKEWNGTTHRVTYAPVSGDEMPLIESGALTLKGDHRSRGLKVVCTKCNNGWMSEIQNKAKPIMLPLLEDRAWHLSRAGQELVAKWAILFTMVYEFADPRTATISSAQRTSFRLNTKPPKNWIIWIAKFRGVDRSGVAFHRALQIIEHPYEAARVANENKAQFTIGAAGQFFFVTFHAASDFHFVHSAEILKKLGNSLRFKRIWPRTGYEFNDLAEVNDLKFDRVMEIFSRALS